MNPFPKSSRLAWLAALTGLWLALPGPGCSTVSDSSSGGFASVTIQNHTVEEIAIATVQVFGAAGYRGGMIGPGKMVFEKAASRMTSLAREGLVSSYYGGQTINRVKAEIVPLGGGTSHRLECTAFLVTGGGDPFFQDEVRLSKVRSGSYQSLLNKVEKQLK